MNCLSNLSELKVTKLNIDLIKFLKKGDMTAFDAIYEKYCNRLYGFVIRYIKQEEEAEEIVQEVFVKLWETRYKIDIYASFESFLFTITYNLTISILRKRLHEKKYLEYLALRNQIEQAPDLINEIYFNELTEKVNSLVNKLSPRQKEIFNLSRNKGLSHDEIAKELNISVNTVKNHLVSALAFLKSGIGSGLIVNLFFANLFL